MLDAIGTKQLALLVAMLCWLFSTQGRSRPGWLLSLQIGVALVVEVWAKSLALRYESNLWIYNATAPVEFTTQFLYGAILVKPRFPWLFLTIALSVYGFSFVDEQLHSGGNNYLFTRSALICAFFLTALFTYLLFQFAMSDHALLHKNPHFWLFLGIVAYYGGMIPMLGLLNSLTVVDEQLASRLYIINDVLYYLNLTTLIIASVMFRGRGPSYA